MELDHDGPLSVILRMKLDHEGPLPVILQIKLDHEGPLPVILAEDHYAKHSSNKNIRNSSAS